MKYLIIISCISFFFFTACEKDSKSNGKDLQSLKLGKILNYFPLETYKNYSKVVFINKDGQEKTFEITFGRRDEQKSILNQSYIAETIDVNYVDPTESDYRIGITVSSNYTDLSKSLEFVHGAIFTSINNGFAPVIRIGVNGEPIMSIMEEEVTLLDRKFNNVYTNFGHELQGANSFTEIYYTPDQGIVGFQGKDGFTWVLKEYKI